MSDTQTKFIDIQPESFAWRKAWACLGEQIVARELGDGTDLAQPNDGECWQFMGAFDIAPLADYVVAEFRHRYHPVAKGRVYVKVSIPRRYSTVKWAAP